MHVNVDRDVVSLRLRELLARAFVHYCVCHLMHEDAHHGTSLYEREKSLFEDVVCLEMAVLNDISSYSISYDDEVRALSFRSLMSIAVDRVCRLLPSSDPNRVFRLDGLPDKELEITTDGFVREHENFVETFYKSMGKDRLQIWPGLVKLLHD